MEATVGNNKDSFNLHSKRGDKSDPAKRGRFLTNGCYTTAEVLFYAVFYAVTLFLHFKHLHLSGSSLHNTGTKSTERIICELQGKTNEIQSLDTRPSFADMLEKEQFNINAKRCLAQAGAKVRQSSNRRQRAFALSKHMSRSEESYNYPSKYNDFQLKRTEDCPVSEMRRKDRSCLRNACLLKPLLFSKHTTAGISNTRLTIMIRLHVTIQTIGSSRNMALRFVATFVLPRGLANKC